VNTSPNYTAAIEAEKDAKVSFVKTEGDRNAIPKTELLTMNVDPVWFTAMALGARRNIIVILEQLAKLPDFDVTLPDKLEDYALGFSHAHTRHLSATKLPDELAAMLEEARQIRDRLRLDHKALAARGLMAEDALSNGTWQSGFLNVAQDLHLITNVFLENWSRIARKCAVDRAELEHGRKLATRMLRQVGERQTDQPASTETLDARARAFTLLVRCYDQICRGVTYVRWREGDAEQIAPSLYKGRRRSSKESEKPSEPVPTPTPINLNAPSPFEPKTTAAARTIPGGSPFID